MRTFLKRPVNEFNIFFCFLTNSVYLKQKYFWSRHALAKTAFYGLPLITKPNAFLLKFFNRSADFWSTFWKILTFSRSLNSAFFVELELIGLGFRIRKISSSVYRFFWGYATFVYLFVPKDILVEYSQDDRMILFFGINPSTVNNFSSYLMLLKKLSTYRVTGFVCPGKIIRLNSGKQR